MNRNVFISFLGTSDYEPCRYVLNQGNEHFTKYVQEALVKFSCREWTTDDRIFIFVTSGARGKNWSALQEALSEMKLNPRVEAILIPEEVSEKTIWIVFTILYEKLMPADNLVIDITHGFRSSPMLLLTLANYSSFLKGTSVSKIYYGAFTAMKSLNTDSAPVWDLTDLILLHEWTLGANEYIKFGNPDRISQLALRSAIPLIVEDASKESATKVTRFAGSIRKASEFFSTVRGEALFSAEIIDSVIKTSDAVEKVNFFAPLQPFMAKTKEKYKGFRSNNVLNFLPSVKYCLDHGLIQQGITFLQEGIISYVLFRTGMKWCTRKESEKAVVLLNRRMASSVMNYIETMKGKRVKKWDWPPEYAPDAIDTLGKDSFCISVSNIYCIISEYRNDINHGGYICPRDPGKFIEILDKGYRRVLDFVTQNKEI